MDGIIHSLFVQGRLFKSAQNKAAVHFRRDHSRYFYTYKDNTNMHSVGLLKISMAVLATFSLLLLPVAVWASEMSPEKNAVAKVFYATSRRWDGKSFTQERGDASKHSFGTCKVHFPKADTRWDIRTYFTALEAQGWEQEAGNKKWLTTNVWRNDSFDNFVAGIRPAVDAAGEVVIYIHGYDNSFDDSTIDGAKLSSYLKVPVVAYSWPTPKTVAPTPRNYHIAENDVNWSQQPFSNFVREMLKEFPGQRVSIVCHSMGSRLVVGALHDLFPDGGEPVLKEVAFASADYDSDTFVQRAGKSISAAKVTRLYISPADKAMGVSQWLVGGNTRMGAPGDNINKITTLPGTEVIDFTQFGGGSTGHSMAHWLISNMHKYSEPGGGWALQKRALKLVKTKR